MSLSFAAVTTATNVIIVTIAGIGRAFHWPRGIAASGSLTLS